MTKRTNRKPLIDPTRMTDTHRQQIERIVQIGAKIGLDQQKQNQEILKAISRSFDEMIDTLDEQARNAVFAALVEVATVADAKRIKQHLAYVEQDAATLPYVASQERRIERNTQHEA